MDFRLNIWIRYLLPFFLALFMGFFMFLLSQFKEAPDFEWYALFWFISVIYLLWESGWYINVRLNQYLLWEENSLKRLFVQLVLTNAIGIVLYNFAYIILNWYETQILGSNNPLALIHILVSSAQAFILIQIMNSIQIGFQLLSNWQKMQLEAEQYKKESISAKLESIRQQIDPHFLFNNFSTLEGLIHESPEKASIYLQKLSGLYRMVLDHLEVDEVTLSQELTLLEAYTELLKIRHGEGFQMKIEISSTDLDKRIIPFALQLLIENALKHNIVQIEKPLAISITTFEAKWLQIKNNIQKRTSHLPSKGIGLKNLSARCRFQTGQNLQIEEDRETFKIRLPLIIT